MRLLPSFLLDARFRLTCLAAVGLAAAGCSPDRVNCEDLVPPQAARYQAVSEMFTATDAKGCARCHNTREPVFGLNFEGPAVTFDALTTRFDVVYDQLESGGMPKDGVRWSRDDLAILRSWYCQGAAYESP